MEVCGCALLCSEYQITKSQWVERTRGNSKITNFFQRLPTHEIITLIVRQWFLLGTFLPKELIKWSPNSQLLRNKFRCFTSSTLGHCVKWKPQRWLSLFFLEEIHSKLLFVFLKEKNISQIHQEAQDWTSLMMSALWLVGRWRTMAAPYTVKNGSWFQRTITL
jgi:hypothetical protein